MKIGITGFFILFTFNFSGLLAQNNVKVIKIDDSHYPKVNIFVKSKEHLNISNSNVFENGKKQAFKITPVLLKEIKRDIKILFIIDINASKRIINIMLKEAERLKKTDELNIGIVNTNKKGKRFIFFISPEFSKNKTFFTGFLKNYFPLLKKNKTKENCEESKKIKDYLFLKKSEFDNIGIFIISENKDFSFDFCSGALNNDRFPVYFLQTADIKTNAEQKIIKICRKTGGMYSQIKKEKDALKELRRYTEDLSYFSKTMKPDFYKISLILSAKTKRSEISLNLNKNIVDVIIEKPSKLLLTQKELFLTIFSSVMFLLLILVLIIYKKKIKQTKRLKETQYVPAAKPIEINIKGKGFNKTYFFEKHIIKIGRADDNDVVIPDMTVSANHAVINKEGSDFYIIDLGSTNGIVADKKKVKKYKLKAKDMIKLGGVVMFIRV